MMKHKEGDRTFDKVVMFEFECRDEPDDVIIRKIAERHFVLLPHTDITSHDFEEAARRSEKSARD
jgi:7,8-dihydro-6-hydroxymethylpterin-pyrophosphokinase